MPRRVLGRPEPLALCDCHLLIATWQKPAQGAAPRQDALPLLCVPGGEGSHGQQGPTRLPGLHSPRVGWQSGMEEASALRPPTSSASQPGKLSSGRLWMS